MRSASTPATVPLDPATLRELERLLSARLDALRAYGPGCPGCHDAEAHAFLARLRALLAAAERA